MNRRYLTGKDIGKVFQKKPKDTPSEVKGEEKSEPNEDEEITTEEEKSEPKKDEDQNITTEEETQANITINSSENVKEEQQKEGQKEEQKEEPKVVYLQEEKIRISGNYRTKNIYLNPNNQKKFGDGISERSSKYYKTPRNENSNDEDKYLADNFWISHEGSEEEGLEDQEEELEVNAQVNKSSQKLKESNHKSTKKNKKLTFYVNGKKQDKKSEYENQEGKTQKIEKKSFENNYFFTLVSRFMIPRETIGINETSPQEISQILKVAAGEQKEINYQFFKTLVSFIKNKKIDRTNEENVQKLWRNIDRYSEGKIHISEAVNILVLLGNGTEDQKIEALFNFCDKNYDNYLNRNEIIEYVLGVLLLKQKNNQKLKVFSVNQIRKYAEATVDTYFEEKLDGNHGNGEEWKIDLESFRRLLLNFRMA